MKVILLLSGRDDPAIGRLGALLADAGLHIERAKRVN
jgi:hypothetical protein